MNDYLKKIDVNLTSTEYEMYQDIPTEEMGSENPIVDMSFEQFKEYIIECIKSETLPNINLHNATTNRYIYYHDNYPIGEIGIRTVLNDFWVQKGSQIFYKVRISKRNKGYGTRMLKLALEECQKLGMKQVRINCNDLNYSSQKIIKKNGGKIDIKSYPTKEGYSSSYIIGMKGD